MTGVMAALDYRTAGESHGQALIALVEGMPAGVKVDLDLVNAELARRQGGYGRGGRMKIERDEVNVLSGVRRGVTIGDPPAPSGPRGSGGQPEMADDRLPRDAGTSLGSRDGGSRRGGRAGQMFACGVWN